MASQKIQGLNIKLSADTSGIDSALKDLNKSINSTSKELKEVDKLLKYDPSNITLLTQKQGLLNDAINNTKKKLEELTKAQELADKEGLASTNKKAYDELQRQIEKTRLELSNFENQTKDTSKALDNAKDSTSTFKDTLKALLTENAITTGLNVLKSGIEAVWNATKQLASSLFNLVKQGVEYNATMETFSVSIKAMLNDDQQATNKLIKSMKDLGAVSGYSNEVLLEGARNLLSADISAEKTTATIEGLAKAITYVGGSNDDLARMITNLQGISSTGKATAQDLKQFKNIGLNVSKLIADQMGITTEKVEEAGVSFDMLSDAFIRAGEEGGKFAEAFDVQANTYQTQANKLSTNWQQVLGNLTTDTTSAISQKILPAINDLLEGMNTAYEEATNSTSEFGDFLGTSSDEFINDTLASENDGIKAMLEAFNQGLSAVIETLSSEGILSDILSGATNLINTIASAFDPSTEEGAKNRKTLEEATATLLGVISEFIKMNYKSIQELGTDLARPIIDGFWEALKESIFDVELTDQTLQLANEAMRWTFNSSGIQYHSLGDGSYNRLASGGVTLNTSFNISNTQMNEASARKFARTMADEINKQLGGMV